MTKKRFAILYLLVLLLLISACMKDETPSNLNDFANRLGGNIELREVYKEPLTYRSGQVEFRQRDLYFTIDYDSSFYGHDSAINRDFVQYGRRFKTIDLFYEFESHDRVFFGSFNGDLIDQLVYYKDGNIYILEEFELEANVFNVGTGSNFLGSGDFNNDSRTDLLFVDNKGSISIFIQEGDSFNREVFASDIRPKKEEVLVADVDGDGFCDIVVITKKAIRIYYNRGNKFEKTETKRPYLMPKKNISYALGDMNSDGFADIVCLYKEKSNYYIRSLFGRGDGSFGPSKKEKDSRYYMNLFGQYKIEGIKSISSISAGNITEDGVFDLILNTSNGLVFLESIDEKAYDYSMHVMKMDDGYIMYSGGRWYDLNTTAVENGDGDHIMYYWSEDGLTWRRRIEGPAFLLGWEEGKDDWWTGNTLEPEVIYIDGIYHMLWQCSFETPKGKYGDKIGYASSSDGINWDRKTDEPVIYNVQNDEIGFNHQELIYVASDPDGKPWHLYVGHHVDGRFNGHVRIRSSLPYSFDWQEKENTSGLGQIGNQIGYIYDDNGDLIYFRITFKEFEDEEGKRTLPTFNISRDGLFWYGNSDFLLAGCNLDDLRTKDNKNVYFLGMATKNGTGEIEKGLDGKYRIIYVATTANNPSGMPIFHAEAGVGEMIFTIEYND